MDEWQPHEGGPPGQRDIVGLARMGIRDETDDKGTDDVDDITREYQLTDLHGGQTGDGGHQHPRPLSDVAFELDARKHTERYHQ